MCFPYASPRIQEIYNLPPEVPAEDAAVVFTMMVPEDAEHVRSTIAVSARTMAPWQDEWRVLNPTRGELSVEGRSIPQREPDRSILW